MAARARRRAHLLARAYGLTHSAGEHAPLDRVGFERLTSTLALFADEFDAADHLPHTPRELDAWFGLGLAVDWQHETDWEDIGCCRLGLLAVPRALAPLFEQLVGDEDAMPPDNLVLFDPAGPVRIEEGSGYTACRLFGIWRGCSPAHSAPPGTDARAALHMLEREGIEPAHVSVVCRLSLWETASLLALFDEQDGSSRIVQAWSTTPLFFDTQWQAMRSLIAQERIIAHRIELRYLFDHQLLERLNLTTP
jgi:hypothetical protein